MNITNIENTEHFTTITYWASLGNYKHVVPNEAGWSEEQLNFVNEQRKAYLYLESTSEEAKDAYERDLWYTMVRSGLFEAWEVWQTRHYITDD